MTILRTFTYRGKTLEISELAGEAGPDAVEGSSLAIRAPGAGQITIHSLQAAAARRASSVRVALTGVVEGGPIASVRAELLLYDREQGLAYGPIHTQYLAASQYRPAAGGLIPVWKTPLRVQISLPAGLRLISDGSNGSLAGLAPVQMGAVGPRLALQASGEYASTAGGAARRAKALFSPDRRLHELLVYAGQGWAQTPRAVQPEAGDRFTPSVGVFEIGPDFRPVGERQALGNGLTCGTAALYWYAAPMMPGDYLAGLAVTDLDGGVQRRFTPVNLS
jgi:hypothetical protein